MIEDDNSMEKCERLGHNDHNHGLPASMIQILNRDSFVAAAKGRWWSIFSEWEFLAKKLSPYFFWIFGIIGMGGGEILKIYQHFSFRTVRIFRSDDVRMIIY